MHMLLDQSVNGMICNRRSNQASMSIICESHRGWQLHMHTHALLLEFVSNHDMTYEVHTRSYESILINPAMFGSDAIALQFVKSLCNLECLCAASNTVHFSIGKPCEGWIPVCPNAPCWGQCFPDSK